MAEGYLSAALFNRDAAEAEEARADALTYELTLLRRAVFTVPADDDGEGTLDVRA